MVERNFVLHVEMYVKGQIISKGLFGVLEFSQKTNERIRHSSKNEFIRSFFGRIWGHQKSFRNDLTFVGFAWGFIHFILDDRKLPKPCLLSFYFKALPPPAGESWQISKISCYCLDCLGIHLIVSLRLHPFHPSWLQTITVVFNACTQFSLCKDQNV